MNGQFTVRVYTQENSAANDESFGIDNVVLRQIWMQKADFSNPKDFQGINCVKITNCDSTSMVVPTPRRNRTHDNKKTYADLPSGLYQMSLNFIKIDSCYVL